jgi:phosphate transport system permease protein
MAVNSQAQSRIRFTKTREARLSDRVFFYVLRGLAVFVVLIFLSLFIYLYRGSSETFKTFGLSFFFKQNWSPTNNDFGALAFIYGTLVSSFLALLIATPISVGSALFLTEVGPKFLRQPIKMLIELLAAIPSVVYGLWAVFELAPFVKNYIQPALKNMAPGVPLFAGPSFGIGLFTAGLVLAVMITPTITAVCVEVFRAIPVIYREGAKALGATPWETIKIAVLGPGVAGIFSAVVLGLGRAMGETMAVTMVIGNRADISASLFAPAATMSSVIANEYAEASEGLHMSSLSAIGLTLLAVSFVVNGTARIIVWRVKRGLK